MPWYVYLALKQLFPSGRRFPFFTAITVLSVSLGVALLILVLGVMGGFRTEVHRMMVETQGDVQVRAHGYLTTAEATIDTLEKVPGVQAVTPFAEGYVPILFEHKPAFPAIQGIDLDRIEKVIPLRKYVHAGSLDDLDDDSLIISSGLARVLGVRLGSNIEVFTPLLLERIGRDEIILPRQMRVVGILEIGHQQLDSNLLICSLRTMQDLYGLGTAVHGINIRLKPDTDVEKAAALINRSLPPYPEMHARSWMEMNEDFLWVLQLEKNMMLFIMLFVVLVAAFLTMSLLLVLVVKKTREIGLLGSLGASRRQIALCFCLQGLFVGVVGTILGVLMGFGALAVRNDVVGCITWLTGREDILSRFYQFSQLPAHTEAADLVVIVLSAILLSTLAGVIPAIAAARMKPVDALRTE